MTMTVAVHSGIDSAVCSRVAYSYHERRSRSCLLPAGEGAPQGRMRGMRRSPWPANSPHPAVPATFSQREKESRPRPVCNSTVNRASVIAHWVPRAPVHSPTRAHRPFRQRSSPCSPPRAGSSLRCQWDARDGRRPGDFPVLTDLASEGSASLLSLPAPLFAR